MLTVKDDNHVRYFGVVCIVAGTYTTIGLIIAWCKNLRMHMQSCLIV